MSLSEIKQEDRRLLMLKALASEGDYSISDVVLRGLLKDYGHAEALHVIHADLAWLQDVGLLSVEKIGKRAVATCSERGIEVSEGIASVPGVRRPRPWE